MILISWNIDSLNAALTGISARAEETREVLDKIHALNAKVGIAIKPKTSVDVLKPYLSKIDLALVMSVEPGFGGQAFDETALAKIKKLSILKQENNYNYLIEVDGGINQMTGKQCKENGAEVLVAGSYVFKNDIIEAVESLC